MSALVAAKHPKKVDRLVLFYPALCIPNDARAGKMMYAKLDPQNLPEQFTCGPMKLGRCYPADVIDTDPFREIQGYDGPVLIVHGTKDKIVVQTIPSGQRKGTPMQSFTWSRVALTAFPESMMPKQLDT